MVHDGLVATTRRTLSGAGAGAPPTPSPALAFIVPAKKRAARLARLEAEVVVSGAPGMATRTRR